MQSVSDENEDEDKSSNCRPIVYERGELFIFEDSKDVVASRVDGNDADACAEDELPDSLCEQPSPPHHPLPSPLSEIPSPNDHNFHSHAADENRRNRPLNRASRHCSDETIFFDVDVLVSEKSNLSLRFSGEKRKNEPEKIACAHGKLDKKISGAKRTNQLFEELNNSKSRAYGNMGMEESRKDTVIQYPRKKPEKSADRPDRISTIDLHCSKFTIGCLDIEKNKKPERCPATCRYFIEFQKAVSDVHQRLLSKRRKKSKRKVSNG